MKQHASLVCVFVSQPFVATTVPTELPDSLDDAALIAAESCAAYAKQQQEEGLSGGGRCRVDFDTTVGDETYTVLKSSTEFMQKFVSALCYATIPGLRAQKETELTRMAQARAELQQLLKDSEQEQDEQQEDEQQQDEQQQEDDSEVARRKDELVAILQGTNREPWKGPVARIYFPDEGSAALARRDWEIGVDVPVCCEFASTGGVRAHDVSKDELVFFFCPQASEAQNVEELAYEMEQQQQLNNKKLLLVFVNPNLVDMGVTGFGMAGRMLRERLIDPLVQTYYLRTLAWGALTRQWPNAFAVWQEDEDAVGGYRLISTLDRLPSNPEVEDIYDLENSGGEGSQDLLGSIGDFVNGMMRL